MEKSKILGTARAYKNTELVLTLEYVDIDRRLNGIMFTLPDGNTKFVPLSEFDVLWV